MIDLNESEVMVGNPAAPKVPETRAISPWDFTDVFETNRRLKGSERRTPMPSKPTFVLLNGKGFKEFCKNLEQPFEPRVREILTDLAKLILKRYEGDVAHVYSDKILLFWWEPTRLSNFEKVIESLSGLAAGFFTSKIATELPESAISERTQEPRWITFEVNIFNADTSLEVAQRFVLDEFYAITSSVQATCRHKFPDTIEEMVGLTLRQKIDRLTAIGVNWFDFELNFRLGDYVLNLNEPGQRPNYQVRRLPRQLRFLDEDGVLDALNL